VGMEKTRPDRFKKGKGKKIVRNRQGKIDPLKTFNARGRGKK
jgi:ATP-dependent RNA helicase DDX56/DBP9